MCAVEVDSPDSFDPDAYFKVLVANASVKDLLRKESELVNGLSFRVRGRKERSVLMSV